MKIHVITPFQPFGLVLQNNSRERRKRISPKYKVHVAKMIKAPSWMVEHIIQRVNKLPWYNYSYIVSNVVKPYSTYA
jgi:hypothetical protein